MLMLMLMLMTLNQPNTEKVIEHNKKQSTKKRRESFVMASKDKISAIHNNVAALTAGGSVGLLAGMSSYFLGEEYMQKNGPNNLTKSIEWISVFFVIGSLITIVLALSFYRDEREELAEDIPSSIHQVRRQNSQPDINEPALLAALSTVILFAGAVQSLRHKKTKNEQAFGWLGPLMYAVGWVGNAYAAATPDYDLSHVQVERLQWTMPGAVAIVSGSLILLWQEREHYISGPAWPLTTLGLVMFGIGNSRVEKPIKVVVA